MKLEVTYAREGLPERTSTLAPRAARTKRPTLAPTVVVSAAPEAVEPESKPQRSAAPPRAAKSKPESRTKPNKKEKAARQPPATTAVSMRAAIRGALALPMDLAASRAESNDPEGDVEPEDVD